MLKSESSPGGAMSSSRARYCACVINVLHSPTLQKSVIVSHSAIVRAHQRFVKCMLECDGVPVTQQ